MVTIQVELHLILAAQLLYGVLTVQPDRQSSVMTAIMAVITVMEVPQVTGHQIPIMASAVMEEATGRIQTMLKCMGACTVMIP